MHLLYLTSVIFLGTVRQPEGQRNGLQPGEGVTWAAAVLQGQQESHRTVESLKLERTFKITKSNLQSSTTMVTKQHCEVVLSLFQYLLIHLTRPGMMVTPLLPWGLCFDA